MASDQHSLLLQDVEAGAAYEHDEPEAASNLEIAPALHRMECPPPFPPPRGGSRLVGSPARANPKSPLEGESHCT